VRVLFGEGIPEVFQELPRPVQIHAGRIIGLIAIYPEMYPVRRFGLRYFSALGDHFYYLISSQA
jgi:hypothetical protein